MRFASAKADDEIAQARQEIEAWKEKHNTVSVLLKDTVQEIEELKRERDDFKQAYQTQVEITSLAMNRAEAAEASLAQAQKERDEWKATAETWKDNYKLSEALRHE